MSRCRGGCRRTGSMPRRSAPRKELTAVRVSGHGLLWSFHEIHGTVTPRHRVVLRCAPSRTHIAALARRRRLAAADRAGTGTPARSSGCTTQVRLSATKRGEHLGAKSRADRKHIAASDVPIVELVSGLRAAGSRSRHRWCHLSKACSGSSIRWLSASKDEAAALEVFFIGETVPGSPSHAVASAFNRLAPGYAQVRRPRYR